MLLEIDKLPFKLNMNTELNVFTNAQSFLLMHIFSILNSNKRNSLLEPFKKLIKSPSNYQTAFLPSIAYDDDFEVIELFKNIYKESSRLGWYQCKNGHWYCIGECTQAMQESVCPTCKEKIGGQNHMLTADNTKTSGVLQQKIQHGYFLNQNMDNAESIRNMGFLNTTVIRLLLNCCLYFASEKNAQETGKVLNQEFKLNQTNLSDFFYEQIKRIFQFWQNAFKIHQKIHFYWFILFWIN